MLFRRLAAAAIISMLLFPETVEDAFSLEVGFGTAKSTRTAKQPKSLLPELEMKLAEDERVVSLSGALFKATLKLR